MFSILQIRVTIFLDPSIKNFNVLVLRFHKHHFLDSALLCLLCLSGNLSKRKYVSRILVSNRVLYICKRSVSKTL